MRNWQVEILAYHRCGFASKGPTEAVNLDIERCDGAAGAFVTSTTSASDFYSPLAPSGGLVLSHESTCLVVPLVTRYPPTG